MELFIGEHGETFLYGIIGVAVVIMICSLCFNRWKTITPEYKTKVNNNNGSFIENSIGKYPSIISDDAIYTEYKNESFNCRDYIKAKDCDGKDISNKIKIYGTVDVFQKGIYKLRCVVVADNQLASTKFVNVVVE